MLRETLSQTDLLELPIFAFVVFLATFLFVVVRVMAKKKNDPQLLAMAAMPLDDDTHVISCMPPAPPGRPFSDWRAPSAASDGNLSDKIEDC